MLRKLSSWFGMGLLLVTASACATGTDRDSDGQPSAATPDANVAQAQVSPIDEYLNMLDGTNLSTDAQIRQREAAVAWQEDFIATCMTELGFSYWPFPQGSWFGVHEGDPWLIDDPGWVAEFGFGVVNFPGFRDGDIISFGGVRPGGEPNPNWLHVDSLAEAEREAHLTALHGPTNPYRTAGFFCRGEGCPTDGGPDEQEIADADAFNRDPANWGCQRQAWEAYQAKSPSALRENTEFAPLFEAIEAFRQDQTLTATTVDREWAACMADAGFAGYIRRPDFGMEFQNELVALTDEITLARPEIEVPHWPLRREDAPEIEALFQREAATALADLACRHETDFDARQQAAIYEVESQFVRDHQVAFNALRDAIEQRTMN